MSKFISIVAIIWALVFVTVGYAQEKQDKTAPTPQQPSKPIVIDPLAVKPTVVVPLKVQVVLSRFQGEKKTSSQPYTLWVSTNDRASLRIGGQVPISTPVPTNPMSLQYKDIGTGIDCGATSLEDGRIKLFLTIDDSSVYGDEQGDIKKAGDHPAFRSFKSTNQLVLRDGQSVQYTAATDKITGETVRVDVTINATK